MNALFSPAKAAREWAQNHKRENDSTVMEAWVCGWNARCIPEELARSLTIFAQCCLMARCSARYAVRLVRTRIRQRRL